MADFPRTEVGGLSVSRLVMGTMVLAHSDLPFACALLDHFVELGGNCLDTARVEGLSAVYLEVEAPNAPAIGLYESFGFVRLRRLADYYGPGRDGCKMVLRLGAAP